MSHLRATASPMPDSAAPIYSIMTENSQVTQRPG